MQQRPMHWLIQFFIRHGDFDAAVFDAIQVKRSNDSACVAWVTANGHSCKRMHMHHVDRIRKRIETHRHC